MNKKQAVRLWEDIVGDSGEAPTDTELWQFANAVEEKARKPFVKLVVKWRRKGKEFRAYGKNNSGRYFSLAQLAFDKAHWYTEFAQKLQNRLDAS